MMIDFVVVSSDLRPYVLDTRVKRGAELSTDHHLVVSWIRWQRRKLDRPGRPKRIVRVCWERMPGHGGGLPSVGLEEILWQTVRRLRRGKQYSANTVYSAGGELLTSTGDIVGRWKKYFEDLLNPTDLPSSEEAEAGDSEGGLVHHPSRSH
ncbi:hypothetical protein L3Q82_006173 [Scortum barcoo]|uniref:Uncharacterized protein n=1 Tax=Scortum barcoo TaxID=214431 RepID=A0ACB8X3R4_9TELE|nr:hypothetical protein L3Q82_006173 [Scortum barcoo]